MKIDLTFLKEVTSSDKFITMPQSTQLLFFHLIQSADLEGFTDQVRSAIFKAKASDADLEALISKGFISVGLVSGVYIADWIQEGWQ